MSDKLDEFEAKMLSTKHYLVEKALSSVMHCAVWCIVGLKGKTDLESLLKIKTMSDKIEAELASELMIRNRYKKHAGVKNYDKVPVKESADVGQYRTAEADPTEEREFTETQYFEANSDGSMHDEEPPFELNKEIPKTSASSLRISQQFPPQKQLNKNMTEMD
jgi:hypothetical protein